MTDDIRLDEQSPSHPKRVGAAMWLGSGLAHAAVLALMAAIITTVNHEDPIELRPFTPVSMPDKPEPVKTPVVLVSDNQDIQLPTVADEPQVPTPLDTVVPDPGDEDASADVPMPKGDVSAVSDVAMADAGLNFAIGVSSGDIGKKGGPFGKRGKPGRKGPSGCPPYSEKDTDHALRWFKRHQSANGMWDADAYFNNCTAEGPKCEPGKNQDGNTDMATTGYAVLCFLGDGYDPSTPSKYRGVVRKGVEWLLANQKPDGLLGERNYEHAVATMALAQAYAMAPEPWLREPTQRAVDVMLARQNRDANAKAPYDRLGWDYVGPTGRNDASVTGWNVMALKSAMAAGLRVGDGITGSKAWLERSWKASNTGKPWCASPVNLDTYKGLSRFAYVWKAGSDEVEIAPWDAAAQRPATMTNQDLAPVGLMCAVFLGHQNGDPMLESLANYVAQYHQPAAWPCNTYYLYYNTLGMFQVGGERWERWAKQVLPLLHDAQRRDEGCMDGSWDWQGTQFHGHDTGRLLSTAYACLSMQVYWIYDRTYGLEKK